MPGHRQWLGGPEHQDLGPDSGKLLEELRGPIAAPWVLNFSPSGKRLATTGPGVTTRVWEPRSLQAKAEK